MKNLGEGSSPKFFGFRCGNGFLQTMWQSETAQARGRKSLVQALRIEQRAEARQ